VGWFSFDENCILLKAPENSIQADYVKRINHVFEHIEKHLGEELSLEKIAQIANFSPFHFHRIFKTIVGETLNDYISRQRLAHAANRLMHACEINIGELAHDFGFSSNAVFTRAFKRIHGMSPSAYRNQHVRNSKNGKPDSNESKTAPEYHEYVRNMNNLKNWIEMNANATVKEMPGVEVAYITCMGVNEMDGAFQRLMQWAGPKGLLESENLRMATIYHDSFKTTQPNQVRMSACLFLENPITVEGEVGKTEIPTERCVVGRFEIGMDEFEKAWSGMFIWLNENGYSTSGSKPYEIYYNDFRKHPEQKFILDICIPIK